ncbi:MAG TPA: DegT/DnrJ/EryC1/StrS family aminotransferase [Thermoprotei archaeon]|nr:DegT/DnrJ/EryC1/StrS family aminotransferase [Thermoprotei archaeon]
MIKDIPPVKPYFPAEDIEEIKCCVENILRSGMLTLHTYTREFEEKFASFVGVKHTVAVNSGTAAIEIALRSMRLNPGDEVLVPTNTFSATATAVIFSGGKPVFTDINPDTLCMSVEDVQERITSKTRGVIVVHIGGLICPDIKEIRELCEDHKIFLIEDAAHAHGSRIDGQHAGSLSDAGAFSFYPTKVITTGEGGMITTNSDEIARISRILRDQGKESFASNNIVELGYNWRMDEISAAIGIVQLKRLQEIIEKRNRIAKIYDHAFERISGIRPLKIPSNILSNYYKYIAVLDDDVDREKVKEKLKKKGVRCSGEVYWPPLHMQPIYQKLLGTKRGDFPKAENICRRIICPPIYPEMSAEDVKYVVERFSETLSEV